MQCRLSDYFCFPHMTRSTTLIKINRVIHHMAIAGLGWLGKRIGVDLLGNSEDAPPPTTNNGNAGWMDQLGKACFNVKKETDEIPKDKWSYVYNEERGIWEPDANAPQHVKDEHEEKVRNPTDTHGKSLKPVEVEPPPPPPTVGFQQQNYAQTTGNYVDCFGGSQTAAPQPPAALPPPPFGSAAPLQQPIAESAPQEFMLKAAPQVC